jgi:hypothetical protein
LGRTIIELEPSCFHFYCKIGFFHQDTIKQIKIF